jgi:hypothetical protein
MDAATSEPDDEYEMLEEFGGVELMRTPTCFAVFFGVDTTGDGFSDDREMVTFDDEGSARIYFNEILQQ